MSDTSPIVNTLASYHSELLAADDEWRLRVLLHDFGLIWHEAGSAARRRLIDPEPAPISPEWDAFIAAYVEHLCWHSNLEAPSWVFRAKRYLDSFWMPGAELPVLRTEAIVHSPAAFEAHGVLIADRELEVV